MKKIGFLFLASLLVAFTACGSGSHKINLDVTGLIGSAVFQNNNADDLTVTADGTASFATKVKNGGAFAVTVATQPTGQTCTVTGSDGVMPAADLTLNVACAVKDGYTCDTSSCRALNWEMMDAGGRFIYNSEVTSAHSCGIREGELFCWGNNDEGQLGTGDTTSTYIPKLVGSSPVEINAKRIGTDSDWVTVAVGGSTSCGIKGAGELYCWGSNRSYGMFDAATWGLLGLGDDYDTTDYVTSPARVGTASDWVSVDVAQTFACGIRDDGTDRTLWCWGRGGNTGNLGIGSDADANVPTQEATSATDWDMVELGKSKGVACGIQDDGTNRTIWCWSQGVDSVSDSATPVQLGSETDWMTFATGAWEMCGIRDNGTDQTLWCRGKNRHGQLAQGDTSNESNWAQVGSDTDWESIKGGIGQFCGLRNSGKLYCWGRDHVGELGLSSDPSGFTSCTNDIHGATGQSIWDCYSPEAVDDTMTWSFLSASTRHRCAISSNKLYCWGWNEFGQAGFDSATDIIWTPTDVD